MHTLKHYKGFVWFERVSKQCFSKTQKKSFVEKRFKKFRGILWLSVSVLEYHLFFFKTTRFVQNPFFITLEFI